MLLVILWINDCQGLVPISYRMEPVVVRVDAANQWQDILQAMQWGAGAFAVPYEVIKAATVIIFRIYE